MPTWYVFPAGCPSAASGAARRPPLSVLRNVRRFMPAPSPPPGESPSPASGGFSPPGAACAGPSWAAPASAWLVEASASDSLDHLIRPLQERRRDRQAEGPGGLEVDDQLKLLGLLDREVGGLGAFEDLIDVDGGTLIHVREIWAIRHEPAGLDNL